MRILKKKYWPSMIAIREDDSSPKYNDVIAWCEENLGSKRYYPVRNVFYFRSEEDATMFALRWR